ncbi:MAG TPA: hypothetical protein VGN34_19000 [Ktedonobacteraceae bacterium]
MTNVIFNPLQCPGIILAPAIGIEMHGPVIDRRQGDESNSYF